MAMPTAGTAQGYFDATRPNRRVEKDELREWLRIVGEQNFLHTERDKLDHSCSITVHLEAITMIARRIWVNSTPTHTTTQRAHDHTTRRKRGGDLLAWWLHISWPSGCGPRSTTGPWNPRKASMGFGPHRPRRPTLVRDNFVFS